MKQLILSLATLAALSALSAHAADLRIEVSTPAGKQGAVLAAIFDKADGFPRGKPLQTAMATPVGGKAVVQFTGLPEGDYAVTAFLDENANMKLDSNLLGIPAEPYGFSGTVPNRMGPATWEQARFSLASDGATVTVRLSD